MEQRQLKYSFFWQIGRFFLVLITCAQISSGLSLGGEYLGEYKGFKRELLQESNSKVRGSCRYIVRDREGKWKACGVTTALS